MSFINLVPSKTSVSTHQKKTGRPKGSTRIIQARGNDLFLTITQEQFSMLENAY